MGDATHKARLIRPDGTVHREWLTDDTAFALTADRHFPLGWSVKLRADAKRLTAHGHNKRTE